RLTFSRKSHVGTRTSSLWPYQRDFRKRRAQRFGELERGLETIRGILGERARERCAKGVEIAALEIGQRLGGAGAGTAGPLAPQQLVHQRGETENVGAPIPRTAGDPFGRRIVPVRGRADG